MPVYVPGGEASVNTLKDLPEVSEFINEAYKHCKTIAAAGEGAEILRLAGLSVGTPSGDGSNGEDQMNDSGVLVGNNGDVKGLAAQFIRAIAMHRHWDRERMLSQEANDDGKPIRPPQRSQPGATKRT